MDIRTNITGCVLPMLLLISACHQAHEVAITGAARPKIDEDDVRFYVTAPAHYEPIGAISAEAHQFTRSGRISNLIQELRGGAAEVGANGVLLDKSQVTVPPDMMTSKPFTSEGAEALLNTDENLRGEAIYVFPDSASMPAPAAPPPAATVQSTPAPGAPHHKAGLSYSTVVVNDTGDPTKNLAIANRTCSKLGKVAQRDEVHDDGTITYLCVDP